MSRLATLKASGQILSRQPASSSKPGCIFWLQVSATFTAHTRQEVLRNTGSLIGAYAEMAGERELTHRRLARIHAALGDETPLVLHGSKYDSEKAGQMLTARQRTLCRTR